MKPEETIDYHVRAVWYGISKMYNQIGLEHDITTSLGFVLLNIHTDEGTPATKIAPLMGMESRSLTRMLKSMEEKGLIERKPNPADGRGVLIHLTEFGREKREYSRERVLTFNETIKNTISEEKLNHFYEVAETITELVSNKKIYNQNDNSIK